MSRKSEPTPIEFGQFEKDGTTVTAFSAEEVVRYRFDGWQEVAPAIEENREPEPPQPSDNQPPQS